MHYILHWCILTFISLDDQHFIVSKPRVTATIPKYFAVLNDFLTTNNQSFLQKTFLFQTHPNKFLKNYTTHKNIVFRQPLIGFSFWCFLLITDSEKEIIIWFHSNFI